MCRKVSVSYTTAKHNDTITKFEDENGPRCMLEGSGAFATCFGHFVCIVCCSAIIIYD